MSELNENQMKRSTSQALYKYVPERWIDFYFSKTRKGYTAYVDRWSSMPLEDVNKKRLLRKVEKAVRSYQKQAESRFEGGSERCLKNFAKEINGDKYTVMTPRISETDRAIAGSISPKVFFCEKCHQIRRFKRTTQYSGILNAKCLNPKCNGNLIQLRDIYYCSCGWAGDVSIGDCQHHPQKPLIMRVKDHKYECSVCHRTTTIFRKCPECGKQLKPNNVLDLAQSFVKNLNMIDLLDEKMDSFLAEEKDGAAIITANYLGLLSDNEFEKTVKYGRETQKEKQAVDYDAMVQKLIDQGLPETMAKIAANTMISSSQEDPVEEAIKQTKIHIVNDSAVNSIAEEILEYNTICKSEDTVSLQEAIEKAIELKTNIFASELYPELMDKLGFSFIQASDKIPFIQCSYGYTREYMDNSSLPSSEQNPVVLKGFPDELPDKKTVYATKLKTEGVLFELDRTKIINWLIRNEIIKDSDKPVDMTNETEIKAWFAEHVHCDLIEPFSLLSEEESITYYTYRLIHTISHCLILAAAEVCGLDKNSLSEYIFPSIPAVFVYCQNTQGFNMGALFSVFEMYFEKWMNNAIKIAGECIFDPICIEHEAACAGCIFTNEISCEHFNHDLDRTMLIGKYNNETQERFWGFWED